MAHLDDLLFVLMINFLSGVGLLSVYHKSETLQLYDRRT